MKNLMMVLMLAALSAPVLAQETEPKLGPPLAPSVKPSTESAPGKLTINQDEDAAPNAAELQLQLPGLDQFPVGLEVGEAWQAWQSGDYVKARVLAARAGANGEPQAKLLFGILLDQGLGGPPNPVNAVKWYREAADDDEVDAVLALAGMAFAARGGLAISDGRAFLRKAVTLGSTDAMLALGRALASGHGGPLDEIRAEAQFRAAIAHGLNPARTALGDLLLTQGKDAEALALYRTAVFGGDAEAAWKAGVLQADPDSAVYAPEKGHQQLLTAAEAGNREAMTALGLFLAGVEPPLQANAARWFRKAAELEEPEGQYLYALVLAKGEGVQQDREMAYEWALRAIAGDRFQDEYWHLADVLRDALPPVVRDLAHARSKMPLSIASANPAPDPVLDPVLAPVQGSD
ncbi:MAG: hypothetical protein COA47_04695 [Robiginitomaculum sp.]|nr:MAG: hypothetical protein COA47_04695 [Robiginitomaculum sp.]